jgi:hypothetical protein
VFVLQDGKAFGVKVGFPQTSAGKWRLFRVALFAAIVCWVLGAVIIYALVRYAGLEGKSDWEIPGLILFIGACLAVFPLLSYPWGLRRTEPRQEQSSAEPDQPRD